MSNAKRDNNRKVTLMGVTDDANLTPTNFIVDPTSKRLKVSATISGGLFQFDATAGATGADYTTVAAAVADSKVNILVINSTTEVANTALLANTTITILSVATIAMAAKQFTAAAARTLTIKGEGTLSYTQTTGGGLQLFDGAAGSILVMNGVTFTNASTQDNCPLSYLQERITNIVINLSNKDAGGIDATTDGGYYDNIKLVGGGTTCSNGFRTNSGIDCVVSNISLSGTFVTGDASGTSTKCCATFGSDTTVNNVSLHTSGRVDMLSAAYNLNNVSSFDDLFIILTGNNKNISNLFLNGGNLDLAATDQNKISNVQTLGLIDMTDTGATNHCLSNCRFTSAMTVAGDRNKFTNCDILGGVSVSSGADNNSFVNCQVGVDAGAGALTITVVAGSNNTRIVGCMTDAAISDAGTGTTTAANIVY